MDEHCLHERSHDCVVVAITFRYIVDVYNIPLCQLGDDLIGMRQTYNIAVTMLCQSELAHG